MTVNVSNRVNSGSPAVFFLVPDEGKIESLSSDLIEACDDAPGIQARISGSKLEENAATEAEALELILREAKVGSRWGKDLTAVYHEFVESMVDRVDEEVLEAELVAQFSKYDADPYESGVLGDILSLGFDIEEQLIESLQFWESDETTFNGTDLAAAVGYANEQRDVENQSAGTVIVEFQESLSSSTRSRRLSYLPRVVQELLLNDLTVVMVGLDDETDEDEKVKEFFRSVGRFEVVRTEGPPVDVPEDVEAWLDEWYERLCYNVDTGSISESVARKAGQTADDLRQLSGTEAEAAAPFREAIEYGLQEYSKRKLRRTAEDRFDELWDEIVTPHKKYDHRRSRRKSFPHVQVARTDGIVREFVLHHEGPLRQLHLNGVPVPEKMSPSKAMINSIQRFLDADHVDAERWSKLEDFVDSELGKVLEVNSTELAEKALLRQSFLPPSEVDLPTRRWSPEPDTSSRRYDSEWYEENWRTILASHRITAQAGTKVIKYKQDLRDQLAGDDISTASLYAKLERDIQRAREYYPNALVDEIRASVPNDTRISVEQRETGGEYMINVTASPADSTTEGTTVTIDITTPYHAVQVDGRSISQPTIGRVTDAVLRSFGGITDPDSRVEPTEMEDLTYNLVKLFVQTRKGNGDRLVYFDDLIEFALSLPKVGARFEDVSGSSEAMLREALGRQSLKTRIERAGGKYHRKGTDPYTGVTVDGDRYIAVELQADQL